MSIPSKNPLRFAGAVLHSGHPNTGDLMTTQGGGKTYSAFSGGPLQLGSGSVAPVSQTGDHAVLVSGAGRLNKAFTFPGVLALSGVAITFYDSNTVTASGPGTYTNKPILGQINGPGGVSGQIYVPGAPVLFEAAFQNGLAVNAPSGAPGFSALFTQEVNQQIP